MLEITGISSLVNTASPRSADGPPDRPVRTITGRELNRRIKSSSPARRALLAYELERGVTQIVRPTYAQAMALTQASAGYVTTVARLSEHERTQLGHGWLSLSQLHKRRRGARDAEIDRLVAQYGADAFLRALDRATAPSNGNAS